MEESKNCCTLYLVRHGETEWNVKKITQGQTESFLTAKGVEQAKARAKELKDIKFDAIFSSDLSRAYKTAEIIKLDRELVIETSKLLRERNYGSFETLHSDVYKNAIKDKLAELEKLSEDESWSFQLHKDVETDEAIVTRFILKLREIAVAYQGKTVLVASHAGPIRMFLIKVGYATKKRYARRFF